MPTSVDVHLGKRVRMRRKLMGWTQADLGAAINQRFQQIHKYECAVTTISAAMLFRLARALGVEVQFFYEGFQDPAASAEPAHASARPDERRTFTREIGPGQVHARVPSSMPRGGEPTAVGASAG